MSTLWYVAAAVNNTMYINTPLPETSHGLPFPNKISLLAPRESRSAFTPHKAVWVSSTIHHHLRLPGAPKTTSDEAPSWLCKQANRSSFMLLPATECIQGLLSGMVVPMPP